MSQELDYKNDANAKPPYSYAALICLSMKDTKKKMTLSQIYKWIRENFAYYRKADKSWQVRVFNTYLLTRSSIILKAYATDVSHRWHRYVCISYHIV